MMNTFSGLFPVILFSVYLVSAHCAAQGRTDSSRVTEINQKIWHDDWDTGMKKAAEEKKPVLVDFYTDWCGVCKAMDKETFNAPEIKERLYSDWICIRINPEHRKKTGMYKDKRMDYFSLSQYLQVSGYPTFIFFDKDGELVQSIVGYKDKDLFGEILDYMKDEAYKKNISFKEYRENRHR